MPEQFKIPQKIDVEDKIFGPFTLRQFLYMIGGGTIVYILFLTLVPIGVSLFFLTALPVALFTLALIFVKINERPFLVFLSYFFIYILEPKIKRWHKSTRVKNIMVQSEQESEHNRRAMRQSVTSGSVKSRLNELAGIVDAGGWSSETSQATIQDRVLSAAESLPTMRGELKSDEPLDDVFADLEQAMENLAASTAPEEDISDLAASLSRVLTRR